MSVSMYNQYLSTYAGKKLLEIHTLSEEGMWQIFGEDPNCDFGGHHIKPFLGFTEGRLEDVVEYAVNLTNFWTWGGGGEIKKVSNVVKVDADTNRRHAELVAYVANLEQQLAAVKKELGVK